MHQSPAAHLENHLDVQDAERRGHRHAEVAGDDSMGVVADEGGPPLAGTTAPPLRPAGHVAADGARGDSNPGLQAQLCGDPLLTPGRIAPRHRGD